ncbi:hypothetical protein B0H19DRAFT_74829 [Mycena capillaripes]|nr:hypothetical protein B0H19DRAFT_74829 [Mycena capillaripes]
MSPNDVRAIPAGPRLPPELERIIFEIVALSRATTIPKLMLIAWRVKDWLEPLLYRTVVIGDSSQLNINHRRTVGLPDFREARLLQIIETKPSFLQHAVKHLFIGVYAEGSAVDRIVVACPHITHLFAPFDPSDHIRALSTLRDVQYLTAHVALILTESGALHSSFQKVTHLELFLFADSGVSCDGLCGCLELMPNLTHIAFNLPLQKIISHTALQANVQLQCIIFLRAKTAMEEGPLLSDSRFLCFEQKMDWCLDWLRGARTGDDYWVLADEFLAARRAKKVDPSTYSIADDDTSWRI